MVPCVLEEVAPLRKLMRTAPGGSGTRVGGNIVGVGGTTVFVGVVGVTVLYGVAAGVKACRVAATSVDKEFIEAVGVAIPPKPAQAVINTRVVAIMKDILPLR